MYTFEQLQQQFITYLEANPFEKKPIGLYQPVDYIMNLGGKHIRPILLLMGYNLFQEQVEPAMPAALAIEVFHNFSLLHDDIMDDATVRRGQPAVHVKYDTNTAILSGDVMLIYVYQYLLKATPKEHLPEVLRIFNQVAIEVCEGQQMDMDFETQDDVTIDEYLQMITLKTSVLIAGALQIGALMGGASAENASHLYEFGKNIGIAFQIQDDLLDTFGDPAIFGKKIGGDIVQNKKTYLYLKAIEKANEQQLAVLGKYYNSTAHDETTKIATITSLFKDLAIDQLAEQLKQTYQQLAFDHLEAVQVADTQKEQLKLLAEQLMGRKV